MTLLSETWYVDNTEDDGIGVRNHEHHGMARNAACDAGGARAGEAMSRLIDMAGRRCGRLTVVGPGGRRKGIFTWECRCDCGGTVTAIGNDLRCGHIRSCGCLVAIKNAETRTTHGSTGSAEHRAWCAMKSRCSTKTCREYPYYGGRGISVCSRWRESFAAFLEDMGPRPSPNHSIDRINNDGNYEPGNCRWATRTEQVRNSRRVRPVIFGGKQMLQIDVARLLGLARSTVSKMVKDGRLQRA